ncbi:MAG: hypothetical protein H7210_09425, partial [Pyrinomonadaceae bacterium]|nr:hypothetical protein [Phycisphaerales bacterium]
MTYCFAGAFCTYSDDSESVLRREFHDAIVGTFRRNDRPDDWCPAGRGDIWCPPEGLLAVCLRSEYTVGRHACVADLGLDEHEEFFEVLHKRLPGLSAACTLVSACVECHGGGCGAEIRTYMAGVCTSQMRDTSKTYPAGLIQSLRVLGCELDSKGVFPPLFRSA